MKSAVSCLNSEIYGLLLVGFILILTAPIAPGYTNPADVSAINNLYTALGSPSLPGWVAVGGDPCAEAWQGIQCDTSNINSIILNGANLRGQLGDNLGSFSSIKAIGLSNNNIGGSIPSNLPVTLQNFFLSDNNFTGSIPNSLFSLSQLSAMSLNDNHLSGEIPDAFAGLTSLVNLDLSSNSLSGQLPPSLKSLSSLTTLHLQNNQLSGTLDVLQDLPLRDMNIEDNQFAGPIPDKLLSIPNFRKGGNPFNTSIPAPPPSTARPPPTGSAPTFFGSSPSQTPRKPATNGPSATTESNSQKMKKSRTKRIVWISIAVVLSFIVLLLALLLFKPRCCRRRQEAARFSKRHENAPYTGSRENTVDNEFLVQPGSQNEKVTQATSMRPKQEHQTGPRRMSGIPKPSNEQEPPVQITSAIPKKDEHDINISRFDIDLLTPPSPPPPPPPPQIPLHEKVLVNPMPASGATPTKPATRHLPPTTVKSYTIAYLQQFTNSFSQENLIGSGTLGNVYKAELPDGKFLAVKKLDKRASIDQRDDEFIELLNIVNGIRHANVVELIGYCAEHGERLLIYEYCSNGTLQDALHSDDEFKKQLSWNIRIRMALGAARALEYLHEVCDPPLIHRNFKSANVLLDNELVVYVSDCGLARLIASGSVSQLSGQLLTMYGYGAPEFESGIYTTKSDVYSFGVVMLELLTGRMSYERTRSRGEQFLVRWAIPQLHDIDALSRMVDPSLNKKYPVKSLSHFADIISRCVQPEPEFRPAMSEVVQDLMQMIRRQSPNRAEGE